MTVGIRDLENNYTEYSINLKMNDKEQLATNLEDLARKVRESTKPILEVKLSNTQYGPVLELLTSKEI